MNCSFLTFLLAGISLTIAHSQPSELDQEALVQLIKQVPSPANLRTYREMIQDKSRPDRGAFAREQLAKGRESVPKLRKLIKIGSNIFTYPGLLARGSATYDHSGTRGKYTLVISASLNGAEGRSLPYEFRLEFDDTGTITNLEDIVYK
jgi:hypothetical protein